MITGKSRAALAAAALSSLALGAAVPAAADAAGTRTTFLLSRSADGGFPNGPSRNPAVSHDQRIARLLIETGKPAEALALLGNADDSAGLEIRGDALVAQDKREQARDLYSQSLAKLDVAAPQRRLLEIKLMDAGGTVADPAAEKI